MFKYSGRNARGIQVSGRVESVSQEAAAEQLMNEGKIGRAHV